MGYDRGDSFPIDFEPNEIPFGSKPKGKLSPRSYPIQCERKWKYSYLSVRQRPDRCFAANSVRVLGFWANKAMWGFVFSITATQSLSCVIKWLLRVVTAPVMPNVTATNVTANVTLMYTCAVTATLTPV